MKLKFQLVVQLVNDDETLVQEHYAHNWFGRYQPPENIDGLTRELAEFVSEGLEVLGFVPRAFEPTIEKVSADEVRSCLEAVAAKHPRLFDEDPDADIERISDKFRR
jgi:hypothetical protein